MIQSESHSCIRSVDFIRILCCFLVNVISIIFFYVHPLNVISNDACFSAGGWLWEQGHIDKPLISAVAPVNECSIFTRLSKVSHEENSHLISHHRHTTMTTLQYVVAHARMDIWFQYCKNDQARENCQWVSIQTLLARFQFLKEILMLGWYLLQSKRIMKILNKWQNCGKVAVESNNVYV